MLNEEQTLMLVRASEKTKVIATHMEAPRNSRIGRTESPLLDVLTFIDKLSCH
jgi:hypothetical protein